MALKILEFQDNFLLPACVSVAEKPDRNSKGKLIKFSLKTLTTTHFFLIALQEKLCDILSVYKAINQIL